MGNDTFDVLILIGRPASGKSEIIDFLKHTAPDIRRSRYHIAELEVMDDFPMLWT
jgi:predicted kinase